MRRLSKNTLFALLLGANVTLAIGCEADSRAVGEDGDADADSDGDSDGDTDSDSDSDSDGDSDCYEENFNIELVPTRVMLLFDVSSSMTEDNGSGVKWLQARDAIVNVLEAWVDEEGIEFGFDYFPDWNVDGCAVNEEVKFDTEPLSAQSIIDFVEPTTAGICGGATPLCAAFENFDKDKFSGYAPVFTGPDANRYLIIVSDGDDMCGNNYGGHPVCTEYDWETTISSDLLANGVKTYAIGFDYSDAFGSLEKIVQAGGTGLADAINVNDQSGLQAELNDIAQNVLSCTFELQPDVEVNYDEVNIYLDSLVVPYDEGCADGSGWDWTDDSMTYIVFCSDICEDIQDGNYSQVTATFGCPTVVIE